MNSLRSADNKLFTDLLTINNLIFNNNEQLTISCLQLGDNQTWSLPDLDHFQVQFHLPRQKTSSSCSTVPLTLSSPPTSPFPRSFKHSQEILKEIFYRCVKILTKLNWTTSIHQALQPCSNGHHLFV